MTTFANQLLAPDKAIWNGLCLNLKLADNETGYEYVIKQKDRNRKKPYIVKFSVDGEKGQKTLHDSSSAEAWEAAAKWALNWKLRDRMEEAGGGDSERVFKLLDSSLRDRRHPGETRRDRGT